MARYGIANRRATKFTAGEKIAARRALDTTFGTIQPNVNVINDTQPADPEQRRIIVVDADPVDMQSWASQVPQDVIVEPEILHWPIASLALAPLHLLDVQRQRVAWSPVVGFGVNLRVTANGSGQLLEGAEDLLFLRSMGGTFKPMLEGRTGADGQLTFSYGWFFRPAALIVAPYANFWNVMVEGPEDPITVDCPPLPANGPLGWWHQVMGIDAYDPNRGSGVTVGVIDTGVGPHPCLGHVKRAGAFIDGGFDPQGGADVDSHGSHVCGLIGARPQVPGQYAGLAPGADVVCARVFPPDSGANQGDIAHAIDAISKTHQADLINMSLGAAEQSQIVLDAIVDALERGTLCICAAGNGPNNPKVTFPAAFSQCVAVSALGRLGWAPPGTLSAGRVPTEPDMFGEDNLFLANFSCCGPELDCGAPGVGIISTVPERFGLAAPYAAMDGTSMASPLACGALAVLLSGNPNYLAMPRDQTRAEMARAILKAHGRDIGLKPEYVGRGLAMAV